MDLFLDLIKTAKLNINEVSITEVTNQYLLTLEILKKFSVSLTSDFLVMAATLTLIKSRKLLPQEDEEIEEIEEIKKSLIESLLNYEKFKNASKKLKDLENQNFLVKKTNEVKRKNSLLPKKPINIWRNVGLKELIKAITKLVALDDFYANLKNISFIPLSEKIAFIKEKLVGKTILIFEELVKQNKTKREMVVTFWALLELHKNEEITLKQEEIFQTISISLNEAS